MIYDQTLNPIYNLQIYTLKAYIDPRTNNNDIWSDSYLYQGKHRKTTGFPCIYITFLLKIANKFISTVNKSIMNMFQQYMVTMFKMNSYYDIAITFIRHISIYTLKQVFNVPLNIVVDDNNTAFK